RPAFGHEARALQRQFHQRVGEREPVLAAGDLAEVADIEPGVALAIEPQDPPQFLHPYPARRRDPPAASEPGLIAIVLIAPAQPADGPRTSPQHLRHLDPAQLPTHARKMTSCTFMAHSTAAAV